PVLAGPVHLKNARPAGITAPSPGIRVTTAEGGQCCAANHDRYRVPAAPALAKSHNRTARLLVAGTSSSSQGDAEFGARACPMGLASDNRVRSRAGISASSKLLCFWS